MSNDNLADFKERIAAAMRANGKHRGRATPRSAPACVVRKPGDANYNPPPRAKVEYVDGSIYRMLNGSSDALLVLRFCGAEHRIDCKQIVTRRSAVHMTPEPPHEVRAWIEAAFNEPA